jgi:pimeloyl-ACP methyl ester carboxylesterase
MKSRSIIFIHGMYMTPLCWENWIPYFSARGYRCLAPAWPGRDHPVEILRTNKGMSNLVSLTLSDVVEHFAGIIQGLDEKPILIGHSMGALTVQLLLNKDLAAAGVAIDSAPPGGVLTISWPFLKSNWPHITPFASLDRPVEMSFERFQYTFVNSFPMQEQKTAFERYVVPESRRVPRQSLTAKVDFKHPHAPLLLIAGSNDHLIPASLNMTNYARYKVAGSITDFKEFEGRTHFIIGQPGWEEVAEHILNWLKDRADQEHPA